MLDISTVGRDLSPRCRSANRGDSGAFVGTSSVHAAVGSSGGGEAAACQWRRSEGASGDHSRMGLGSMLRTVCGRGAEVAPRMMSSLASMAAAATSSNVGRKVRGGLWSMEAGVELIIGPMFAGKTTELLRRCHDRR